jgi:hypothetical protein
MIRTSVLGFKSVKLVSSRLVATERAISW